MADPAVKTETRAPRRPEKMLRRLIRAEWDDLEVDHRDRFAKIGELLHELRPQVPDKQWKAYVTKHFPFSTASAWRYEKFFLAAEGRARAARPQRLSDVEQPRPASHHAPIYEDVRERVRKAQAWSARIDANRKVEASQAEERAQVLKAAHRIVDTGFRIEAHACHPDHGGSATAMRILKAARDKLRACLAH